MTDRQTPGPQFCRAYTSDVDDLMRDPPGAPIPFIASTPGTKRDGLNLRSDGWMVDNYQRSGGPVLWNHDHTRPAIGSGAPTVADKLRIAVSYDMEDEFARAIESKVRRKFLRAGSVGWDFATRDGRLLQHTRMSVDYLSREAFYELSEFSMVNVPADPTALAERHLRAMRSLGRELAGLYGDQERADSDAMEHEVRAAVLDECRRLGIPVVTHADVNGDDITRYVRGIRVPGAGAKLRASELPALLRDIGAALLDEDDPAMTRGGTTGITPPASVGIDQAAAASVLAAFPTLKGSNS